MDLKYVRTGEHPEVAPHWYTSDGRMMEGVPPLRGGSSLPLPLIGKALALGGKVLGSGLFGKAAAVGGGIAALKAGQAVGNRIPVIRRFVPGEDKGIGISSRSGSRRRKRRLVTKSDMQDIAAMKAVLGDGKNFQLWLAQAMANR